MKKINRYILLVLLPLSIYSCKRDNYDAPEATIQGAITDANNVGLQLEQGQGSARIKLEEVSWSNSPAPQNLNLRQDGSFINTKLFPGKYRVSPTEGPFYPVTTDQVQTVDLVGGQAATVNFKVVPYLNVEWVSGPTVTADKKITASFKFTRLAAPTGQTQPAPLDYQLFISTTQYVGNNNFDNTRVGGVVTATAAMDGQTLTITSSQPMKYSSIYYIRVGVRVNDSFKKYNYTPVKTANVTL